MTITATGADGTTRQISTNSQVNGNTQDKPTQSTTYAATATGPGGSAQQQAKVAVNQPLPTLTFTADKTTIASGGTVNLSWQTTNATSIAITAVGADGVTRQISTATNPAPDQPTENTTYTAIATGPGGNSSPQQVSVTVTQLQAPTLVFSASSNSITKGDTVYLSWQLTNATSIQITAKGADGVTRQIPRRQTQLQTADRRYNLHGCSHRTSRQYCASIRIRYCCPGRAADNTIERKSCNPCCGRILNVDLGDY